VSEGEIETPADPGDNRKHSVARVGLNLASAIPWVGNFFSAVASAWSEHDQEQVNNFFRFCIKLLEDEMKEKAQTIFEIMARIDVHDEEIGKRVRSDEYQSLVRKALRDWAGAESEQKRQYVRNVLANAAADRITSDDVIRLFLDWIKRYNELHFKVIAEIYRHPGSTRWDVWVAIGKGEVRENSSEADLFKLLYHELTTGYIIRQERETDADGRFIVRRPERRPRSNSGGARYMKSAFADDKAYYLTELGQQFVHYAMTEVPTKIEYKPQTETAA
jgi:hypothetical protein